MVGSGGMATVWRARDRELGRIVALKRPHPSPDGSDIDARFRREAQSAAAVTHPHLVTVYDVGTDDAGPYLVMELLDAPSLAETTVPADKVGRVGVEVASALAALHAAGIVHRDVKPANILLGEGGAKLTDFGIARSLHETRALTQEGMVVATPAYAAPEVLAGADYTERSDVYALGTVLRELVTGRRSVPNDGTEVMVTDPTWRALLEAALSPDPSRRPTAADLATALRGAAGADSFLVDATPSASAAAGEPTGRMASIDADDADGVDGSPGSGDDPAPTSAMEAVVPSPPPVAPTGEMAAADASASDGGSGTAAAGMTGSWSTAPNPSDAAADALIVVARPRDRSDRGRRNVVVLATALVAVVVVLVAVGLARRPDASDPLAGPAGQDGAVLGVDDDGDGAAPPTVAAEVVDALTAMDDARSEFLAFVESRRDVTIDPKDADRITEDVAGAMTAVAESDERETEKRFEAAFRRLSKFDDAADEAEARDLLATLVSRLGLGPLDR